MFEPVTFVGGGIIAGGCFLVGWLIRKCSGSSEQPIPSEPLMATPHSKASPPPQSPSPSSPAPSLISRVSEEVKQVCTDSIEAVRETVSEALEIVQQRVEGVKEFFADAPERVGESIRLFSRATIARIMGLVLPRAGMVQCSDVDTLPKALLKTPPRTRAPSLPLFA
jgi:hypothetical protein